jgi:putative ABC transport system permease protein
MRVIRRLAYWLRLRSKHTELLDELAFHREMVEQDLMKRGMSPAAARTEARRTMGNDTVMREEARAVWLWPSLEALWQDATYTIRDLRRNPTFTIGVALTLALGIGANAAMFSLIDRLLFRPPAFMVDPSTVQQVYMYRTSRGQESGTGGQYARYADLARYSTAFSQIAGVRLKGLAVGMGEGTRVRNVAIVSAGFFGFFDAPPALGRYFTAREDTPPDPAPVAVLSHALWTTQFGARRDVLGATLRIDAVEYTIIGVTPEGFVGLWPYRPPVAFVPLATYARSEGPPDWATTYGHSFGIGPIVRRKPDVTIAQASADLTNALRRSYQAQYEGDPAGAPLEQLRPRAVAASVLAERGPEPSSALKPARWLAGVTLIVLLIAAANVANLLLARAIRRRREIAVRLALGVSRRRLFGQLLTEGVILALVGAAAGVALAVWGGRVLSATFLPDTEPVSIITDARTLGFSTLVALGVGMLTAMAPMAQLGRTSLVADLKSGPREGTHGRSRLRTSLLLLQSALSVVLLVGAGLFVQSLRNVRDVRLGFDADPVLVVELEMRDVRLDSAATVALRLRLLEAAKGVPGVSHASLRESIPFAGMSSYPLQVAGMDSVRALGEFRFNAVSAEYFAAMGTRILRGRGFESTDREGTRPVLVVGQSMANVLWPGKDPIGQCVRVGLDSMPPCRYVVGVAEDIHSESIEPESKLFFYYMPALQWKPQEGGLFVRAAGEASRVAEPLRRALQREMPGTAFVTVNPMGNIVGAKMRSWIVGATLFTAFGVLALVLAAVGLYSVMAYNVAQRKHELGVRLALGAARTGIVRIVVTESLRLALTGVGIGAVAALAGGPWISSLLFRQSPRDPAVFAVVTVVLTVVAVAASAIPALRAARLDPKTALQAD